jgi:hypothetical protein
VKRLITLEDNLKHKFGNVWVSVRRAFLDLDVNHVGSIAAEDIIRYFG